MIAQAVGVAQLQQQRGSGDADREMRGRIPAGRGGALRLRAAGQVVVDVPADDGVRGRQHRERRGLAARCPQVRHGALDLGVPAQCLALLAQHPPEHQTQLAPGAGRQPSVGEQPFQHRDRLGLAEPVDGRPAQLGGEPNPYRPGQLGDVHRLEQEAGGGRVVAALGRQVGGRLGVADEVGAAAGPTVVVRQQSDRSGQLLLQHSRDPQVQPFPVFPGHQVVHHLPGQVVAEP